jgi:hypothetical protein
MALEFEGHIGIVPAADNANKGKAPSRCELRVLFLVGSKKGMMPLMPGLKIRARFAKTT